MAPSGSYTQTSYTYGNTAWKDQLTAFDGKTITYDAIGNPLTYNGITFTWQGRRMMSYTTSSDTVSYEYNADGIRTAKTVNGIRHEYYLNGSQIIREVIYDSTGTYITTDLWYCYDGEGHPTSIRYLTYNAAGTETGDTVYHLVTNAQGDVTGICDASGNLLYTYIYDAWGTVIQGKQIASGGYAALFINPFLYRGYYCDMETGLYYLNSRYYNPQWGRFLNADGYVSTGTGLLGYNMYAYCNNNPVMYNDPSGESIGHILVILAAVGAALLFSGNGHNGPTEEQIEKAVQAADNAKLEVNNKVHSIDIIIDQTDSNNHFDPIASQYYYERLYDRTVEYAQEEGIETDNLMTISHIRWEYNVHVIGYHMPFESIRSHCEEIHLNKDETILSIIGRGWGAIKP